MRVVCTAGHVDHGKSTLVEALTGTHPDRFAEERERGLTIDLGFAWTDLEDGQGPAVTVSFVDLPGHERFVGNMLAGAGGVDVALLVVAADEGWMPQSAEHLAILDLLGVSSGLVAVTKSDLVDEETAALAVELVREELAGTTLAAAEIVACSAATGQELDTLREALVRLLRAAPDARDVGRPRLWVDRAFTITGAGTVMTGTLQGGSIHVGDTIAVLPDGRSTRVRGLQQLGRDVDVAMPGTRVAINVTSLDVAAVPRGTALGAPGAWRPTQLFDAHVRTLPLARIGRRGAWKLHAGSGVWGARVTPLDQAALSDGKEGFIRVELDAPVPLVAGDRFVLRDTGRRTTAGGGVVLDADPLPRPRGAAARATRARQLEARSTALAAGDTGSLLARSVAERGAVAMTRAAAAVGAATEEAGLYARRHGLVPLGAHLVDPDAFAGWTDTVLAALREHHRVHPVERGARRDVASRALSADGCPADLVPVLLDELVARGEIVADGPVIRAPEHAPVLDDAQRAARRVLVDLLSAQPFAPPKLAQAASQAGASAALVREMEASGDLIRLSEDVAVPPDTLRAAHRDLWTAFQREGPLTASRAKETLETSRKFAMPLLEELDRRRITRRVGDVREVAPPEEPNVGTD